MQSKTPQPTGKSEDQAAGGFSNTPESIDTILCRRFLMMPELQEMIKAEVAKQTKPMPEYFTREEMASLFKVHPLTVSRMSDEQVRKHGFIKTKINGSLRFTRI